MIALGCEKAAYKEGQSLNRGVICRPLDDPGQVSGNSVTGFGHRFGF